MGGIEPGQSPDYEPGAFPLCYIALFFLLTMAQYFFQWVSHLKRCRLVSTSTILFTNPWKRAPCTGWRCVRAYCTISRFWTIKSTLSA